MFKAITTKKLPNIVNFQVPIDKFRFLFREKPIILILHSLIISYNRRKIVKVKEKMPFPISYLRSSESNRPKAYFIKNFPGLPP